MLAWLSVRLAVAPERSWPEYAAASSTKGLPSPTIHVAIVAVVAFAASLAGGPLREAWTASGVLLHSLATFGGYALAGLLVVQFVPVLLSGHGDEESLARFAAGAVQPLLLSGACSLLPVLPANVILAGVGTGLCARSAWVGARSFLRLEGPARVRAASLPAALSMGPVLLAALVRWTLPT